MKEPDLKIGEKFNRWTILKKAPSRKYRSVYLCQCECGVEKEIYAYNLKFGKSKSCGCWAFDHTYTGFEEISGTYWVRIKSEAKRREILFEISIEEMWKLFLAQKRKCALSDLEIKFAATTKEFIERETTASIDRIDSSKGYTSDNVQWVHKDINRMKWNLSEEYFKHLCEMVSKKNKDLLK
jgi:hypothetical protein